MVKMVEKFAAGQSAIKRIRGDNAEINVGLAANREKASQRK